MLESCGDKNLVGVRAHIVVRRAVLLYYDASYKLDFCFGVSGTRLMSQQTAHGERTLQPIRL